MVREIKIASAQNNERIMGSADERQKGEPAPAYGAQRHMRDDGRQ
jgi:hypothetical protein